LGSSRSAAVSWRHDAEHCYSATGHARPRAWLTFPTDGLHRESMKSDLTIPIKQQRNSSFYCLWARVCSEILFPAKRQRAGALQDAGACFIIAEHPQGFELRRPSAAFENGRRCIPTLAFTRRDGTRNCHTGI
jgi:hypothetical protein